MYIVTVISHSNNTHETFKFLPPLHVFIQCLIMGLSGKNTKLIGNTRNIFLHNKWKGFVVEHINLF